MATNGPQKVESLFLDTDFVTLVVGLGADDTTFRVFRVPAAILRIQSTVFADMFAIPQCASTKSDETEDGSPLVRLHDTPNEFEVFLKAILFSDFFTENSEADIVIPILRLAHKYDVQYLRRRALDCLATMYPTTLSAYDKAGQFRWMEADNAFSIIKVGVEVDELWLLPAAYHNLCRFHIADVMSWDDLWSSLPPKEQTAFIVGYAAQTQYFHKMRSYLLVSATVDCVLPAQCRQIRLRIARTSAGEQDRRVGEGVGEGPLEAQQFDEMEHDGVCASCLKDAKLRFAAERKLYWTKLPEMFGLPGWDDLSPERRRFRELFGAD